MTTTTDTEIRIDPLWRSWEGAHGGHVAALALAAVRDRFTGGAHPVRTLTTHYLAPVGDGPLHFSGAAPAGPGRRTATCVFTGHQNGVPVISGSALFGSGRQGPSYDGSPVPRVPEPQDCRRLELPGELSPFARQLEIRPATADLPLAGGDRAELTAWIRFLDGRALDAPAAVTLTDVLPPALYARWRSARPVPTAELTVHLTDALDDGPHEGWALVRIRTGHAGSGWAVDDSAVWSADGRLLALARQSRVVRPQPAAGSVNS
ncbi:thioesterase family protein [Streptomyces sp. ISL-22]|uniref:thioesterase family protein n=1 Tax=unclassified Streptomyces TaxID=2593676 RepID=UPI001BEC1CFD|nr:MULTISPECIES: thioesterase family protein [unclassified Streptomyces]MBT2420221.1 thioesterase family protein [Streptomyces sp. ISL-24]MBT2433165.1 thioesterase family protein [Streptomyces sp. ISL-22]